MDEKEIKKDLVDICNRNDKETAIKLIKEKYIDCAIELDYRYSKDRLDKMFMGMFMWEDLSFGF